MGKQGWRLLWAAFIVAVAGAALLGTAVAGDESYPSGSVTYTFYPSVDTKIASNLPTTNYGSDSTSSVSGRLGYPHNGTLMKFDISTLPSDRPLIAAHVSVVVNKSTTIGTQDSLIVGFYRVLKPWVEGEATYNKRTTDSTWATAGLESTIANWNSLEWGDTLQNHDVYDRLQQPSAIMHLGGTNSGGIAAGDHLYADVTQMVRRWYYGQWDNDGWVMLPLGNTALDVGTAFAFKTSEAFAGNRPVLTVVLGPTGGASRIGAGKAGIQ